MQALISTPVSFCYASADRTIAERVAEFLERCGDARVHLEDGEVRAGDDVCDKVRDARTSDTLVVLFTQALLPRPWSRQRWEGPLISEPAREDVRIAFAVCDACEPPPVLKPRFDLRDADGLRRLKRWIRGAVWRSGECGQALEEIARAIADRAGCATVAAAAAADDFVEIFQADFDSILRLECAERSTAALAGDLAAQLGLQLAGPLEENLARLRQFCESHRFLLVLDGGITPEASAMIFAARTSTLITESARANTPTDPLRLAQLTLANLTSNWETICSAARQGRRICNEQGRIAECYELMQQWREAAEARGDRVAAEEAMREMIWILEQWGQIEEARDLEYQRAMNQGAQMTLAW